MREGNAADLWSQCNVSTFLGEFKQSPMGRFHKLFLNQSILDTLEDYSPSVEPTIFMSYQHILSN